MAGSKEGSSKSGSNRGQGSGRNLKNDPQRASEAGKKGGEHSHGGTHDQNVKAGQQSLKNK